MDRAAEQQVQFSLVCWRRESKSNSESNEYVASSNWHKEKGTWKTAVVIETVIANRTADRGHEYNKQW